MKSEMTPNYIPGFRWLGYTDSREYAGDTDDDYILKHFFVGVRDDELQLIIVNELNESFYGQAEGECNWPCTSEEDREVLEKILIKSLGELHPPKL